MDGVLRGGSYADASTGAAVCEEPAFSVVRHCVAGGLATAAEAELGGGGGAVPADAGLCVVAAADADWEAGVAEIALPGISGGCSVFSAQHSDGPQLKGWASGFAGWGKGICGDRDAGELFGGRGAVVAAGAGSAASSPRKPEAGLNGAPEGEGWARDAGHHAGLLIA